MKTYTNKSITVTVMTTFCILFNATVYLKISNMALTAKQDKSIVAAFQILWSLKKITGQNVGLL